MNFIFVYKMDSLTTFYQLCTDDIFTEKQDISFGTLSSNIDLSKLLQTDKIPIPTQNIHLLLILWKDSDTEIYVFYSLELLKTIVWCGDIHTLFECNCDPLDIYTFIVQNKSNAQILHTLTYNLTDKKHIIGHDE